jgi:DNA polymerase III, epsilon subunit and related 3''-5'' exonucleases
MGTVEAEGMESGAGASQLNLLSGFSEAMPAEPIPVAEPIPAAEPEPAASDDGPRRADPRTLLILDTETSGLDPEQDQCLEVGAILFDVPEREVLVQQSFLLPVDHNPAQAINHIAASATRCPQPWREGLRYLQALMDTADLLVAHHAAFDRQWFGRGHLPAARSAWLCTMDDIRWPAELQLRPRPSVRDLALAHGIPVWAVHRALADCVYIAEVFKRRDDLEDLIRLGLNRGS